MTPRRVARTDAALTPLIAAERCGMPKQDLLHRPSCRSFDVDWAGLPSHEMPGFVSITRGHDLCSAVRVALPDVDLITPAIEAMGRVEALGDLGFMLMTAPTLGAAVRAVPPGFRAMTNNGFWSVVEGERHVTLEWDPQVEDHCGVALSNEWVLLHMATVVLQQLTAEPVPIEKVTLRHGRLGPTTERARQFDIKLEYGAPRDSVVLSREVLALRPRLGHSGLHARTWLLLNDALAEPALAPTPSERLRKLLEQRASLAKETLDESAHGLGVSPVSLQRALRREGTTHSAVRQRIRAQRAQELVLEAQLSLTEVAHQLAMTPPSFSRFYRRAFGHAPQEARKRQLGNPRS